MFTMRLKLGSIRNNEWRCCFCFHVRTATIVFGIWHLVLHILALTVLALIMRNHHIIIQKHEEYQQNDFLPTPLSKVKDEDNPYYLPTTQDGRPIYSSDIDMGALMTVCTLSITLLMVYGTIKGKPTHLLPFFCLQLFDFAITTLTATGYFCYLKSVHRLVAEHWNLPFRHELLQLSPQVLSFIVLTAFLSSMVWKAYWISVIWRCYKYLTLRQQTMRNTIHYILPEADPSAELEFPSLFRDHDSMFGSALKQTPPPSYQDIMEDQPPPYPAKSLLAQVFDFEDEFAKRDETDVTRQTESQTNSENTGKEVILMPSTSRVEINDTDKDIAREKRTVQGNSAGVRQKSLLVHGLDIDNLDENYFSRRPAYPKEIVPTKYQTNSEDIGEEVILTASTSREEINDTDKTNASMGIKSEDDDKVIQEIVAADVEQTENKDKEVTSENKVDETDAKDKEEIEGATALPIESEVVNVGEIVPDDTTKSTVSTPSSPKI